MESLPYLGETLSVSAALCWAVGVILFKKSGEWMPAMSLNMFKNLLAVALLTPTIPLLGGTLTPDNTLLDWGLLGISGFLGIALADTLFFMSLSRLGAGLTAVVDTSYMPIMLALSFVFLGERVGLHVLFGAALIMGALLVGSLSRPEPGKRRVDIVAGVLIGISGIALMAASIVMIKHVLVRSPMLWSTWVRLLAGVIGLVPLMLIDPRRRKLLAALRPGRHWRHAAPGAAVGTYLAMIAWIGGMKHTEVSRAALLNQLSTIFIFVLAVLFLREPLTRRRLLAIGLAVPGAFLVII
ncbi:MAG: DMT family transporter [Polyangia bacterium]